LKYDASIVDIFGVGEAPHPCGYGPFRAIIRFFSESRGWPDCDNMANKIATLATIMLSTDSKLPLHFCM